MRYALILAVLIVGCRQRTGGEESIPRVLFTHEDSVTYCQYKTKPSRLQPCVPETTNNCPVFIPQRFRTGDEFNPLEYCDE